MEKRLSSVRLLLQHGANLNILMPDGHSPLYLVVNALSEAQRRGECYRTGVVELLQLMVKHGAMLQDSSSQLGDDIRRQSPNSGIMKALATFDGKHEFIIELFRAGAGFQLISFCCTAVGSLRWDAKSSRLCQAVVLAGYSPSAEELQNLHLAATSENASDGVLEQVVNWLNEDRQQVPSLVRQCRVAIRRQLSVAVHYQTILPAIDKLPLPNKVKLYLQFDGPMSEVDISVNKELQTSETTEDNRHELLSPSEYSDYMHDFLLFEQYYNACYDSYDSDNDYYYRGSDIDSDSDDLW